MQGSKVVTKVKRGIVNRLTAGIKGLYHSETYTLFLLIFATIFLLVTTAIINSGTLFHQAIPPDVKLSYKAVEPGTGGFLWTSGVQYYIFDIDGNRYSVSQSVFDSYKDLPRK